MVELSNKKRLPRIKESIQRKKEPSHLQAHKMPSFQSISRVGTQESGAKDKEKEGSKKPKDNGPSYKLQLNIKNSIDMKKISVEKIFDAKIEFTLREILGIAKKNFYELIINVIEKMK